MRDCRAGAQGSAMGYRCRGTAAMGGIVFVTTASAAALVAAGIPTAHNGCQCKKHCAQPAEQSFLPHDYFVPFHRDPNRWKPSLTSIPPLPVQRETEKRDLDKPPKVSLLK